VTARGPPGARGGQQAAGLAQGDGALVQRDGARQAGRARDAASLAAGPVARLLDGRLVGGGRSNGDPLGRPS
jgi:hypothetical protein